MLFSILVTILTAASTITADQLRFDTTYDNENQSLATVACSNGENGLLTKNFTTFGSLPNFPNIGGASAVTMFNSPNCGSCWNVTFTNASTGDNTTLSILAIDVAATGFVVSLEAMNNLTDGNAVALGVVNVDSVQVNSSVCGL
ncbi:cerato-platanin-related secreted protein [Lentinula raphanica]|uniref:Cerato-platanin-related secreted protein n=1 Tax=Lentinula raphanica TaxID=153919 RepID=A0AA38PC61_9AGAR|nr:cerato-platanin-related secreted protein [Lentinula raphanica]KAJ3840203.1 cerato-platanin-related secreted protein [Lentinula raphanica]KAJ3966626.1 cerato-platanin-related secreted protein [Lentinula raphanica]